MTELPACFRPRRALTRPHLLALAGALLLGLTPTASRSAEVATSVYLPNQAALYNPLQHGRKSTRKDPTKSTRQLSNAALLRSAEQMRATNMSVEQRALNYQWLQQAQDGGRPLLGSKVLSSLARMGFRTYWEGNRLRLPGSTLLSGVSGAEESTGGKREDLDYRLQVSGDELRLRMTYEF